VIEIHIPARLSKKDERALIPEMIKSVLAREARKRSSDSELFELAGQLLTEYLPEFHERPKAITWRVMRERWGSCTTSEGTIRISTRLNGVPEYALEYVLFHELIHLRFDDHGVAFNAHLERFPRKAEAEAFLEGFEAGLACPSELN
jgi:predicted metal-dependent hydrolase